MLPDDFHAITDDGEAHEFKSLLNASPEFILAMSNELPQFACPCANCHDGVHIAPVYGKISILGLEFQGITGIILGGPCPTCAGAGWVYGICPS